jgi:iron complex outermembrane receptor protein
VTYTFRDLELLGLPPYYVFPQGPTIAVGKAVFGQATYSLSKRLRGTAGVRFSQDHKSRIGATNFQQTSTFNPATDLHLPNRAAIDTRKTIWRLGAEFDLAPATLLFGTISTGYKAGGFNDGCLEDAACPAYAAVPAETLFYQPETLTSYEGGIKTRFWDGKASLNASAFYYDYGNLQLSGIAVVNNAPRFITTNAGMARVKGLEMDGQVFGSPSDRFSYSLALLDAIYVSYKPDGVTSWAGRKLDRSPSAVLGLGYERTFHLSPGQFKASIFSRASGQYVISVPSLGLQYPVPAYTESDLTLTYRAHDSHWHVQGLIKNLEDKVIPIAIDSVGQAVPSNPRTFAVRLVYRF